MQNASRYSILPRFFYLKDAQVVNLNNYIKKYEISRSTFFRDLEVLKDIADISFEYDSFTKCYKRIYEK